MSSFQTISLAEKFFLIGPDQSALTFQRSSIQGSTFMFFEKLNRSFSSFLKMFLLSTIKCNFKIFSKTS